MFRNSQYRQHSNYPSGVYMDPFQVMDALFADHMNSVFGIPRLHSNMNTTTIVQSIEESRTYTAFANSTFPTRIEEENEIIDLTEEMDTNEDDGPFEYDFKTKKWIKATKSSQISQESPSNDSSLTIVEVEFSSIPISFTPYIVELPD